MSKIWSRLSAMFRNRTFIGADRAGNQYYVRTEQIDGISKLAAIHLRQEYPFDVTVKEKRWVEFKAEDDPTSIPVEWICWLNGQRKIAPTPEEMLVLEARRQRVKENVALLKKEEEERKAREGSGRKITSMAKGKGPDLKSFIQQLPLASEDNKSSAHESMKKQKEKEIPYQGKQEPESTEPTGSGASFRPGTWQPPT